MKKEVTIKEDMAVFYKIQEKNYGFITDFSETRCCL